ncbi:MAG TPA: CocE/NonD family hydrolase [Vicinamibacteria bacterium]|nr:CocE/NonD family hydrolase [Vicinamibacteria bacterium]
MKSILPLVAVSGLTMAWLAGPAPVTVVRAQAKPLAAAPFDILVHRHVMVAARDGVRLATDIYLPARNGVVATRVPAIVERTPYNKDRGPDALVNFFVPRGYAVVFQDVRGRYRSEGKWRPITDDGPDGADLLKWIAEQSWSSGKVGMVGTSYAGATQHAVAITGAPALAALVPVDAMSDPGYYGIRHNGAFELRWLNWIFTLGNASGMSAGPSGLSAGAYGQLAGLRAAKDPPAGPALTAMGGQVREFVKALPLRPGATPLKFAPDYESWLIEAMRHGGNDAFWADMGSSVVDHVARYQDVPVMHLTGWYDSWGAQVANLNYVELSKAKKQQQRLVVGPWTHGGQGTSFSGIAEFGPAAAISLNELRLRWFERWLKGVDNGVERDTPVRLFVMGAGEPYKTKEGRLFVGGVWRDEREWPLSRAVNTEYFLHADGALSTTAPAEAPPTRYDFDPRRPVPTIGGNVSSEGVLMLRGAQDQRCTSDNWLCTDTLPLSARPDVVVFQTPALDRDVEVTGRLVVKLWASSDGPDTDFTAKLVDVYPPSPDFPAGVDLNVGDSIVRARYRESLKTSKPLEPGKPYEFTIEMYPTSLVFRRGHRIRVDISSSNFPRFDVNPNTGEPLNEQRRSRVAVNAIYHDPAHPSRIILPIVPIPAASPAEAPSPR